MAITLDGTAGINTSGTLVATGSLTTSSSLTTGTGAIYNGIQASTSVATTSGTSVDFTSIPSWVKKITLMMNQVSISSGNITVQLGTSGGIVSTGYLGGSGVFVNGNTTSVGAKTAGFPTENSNTNIVGIWTICNFSGNTWTAAWNWNNTGSQCGSGGSYIALGSALTTVRVLAGAGTFSAGSVNILYE